MKSLAREGDRLGGRGSVTPTAPVSPSLVTTVPVTTPTSELMSGNTTADPGQERPSCTGRRPTLAAVDDDRAGTRRPRLDGRVVIARFFGVPVDVTPAWFLVAALITLGFAAAVEESVPGLGPWRYAVSGTFAVLLYLS